MIIPLRRTPLACLFLLTAATRSFSASFNDFHEVTPQGLYIPENDFGAQKLGSWQQTATAGFPTVPQNWAEIQSLDSVQNSAVVKTPFDMKHWGDPVALFQGNMKWGLFSPGENSQMSVGVVGNVASAGIMFASGNTRLFELESPAKIQGSRLRVALSPGEIRGSDGSTIYSPSPSHAPVVELGVPLEVSMVAGNLLMFHLYSSENGQQGSRLTLSANNTAPNTQIRSWGNAKSTIVINAETPFGASPVLVVNGISFEVKDFATTPSRTLNNNFSAQQAHDPFYAGPDITTPSNIEFKGNGNLTFNGNLTTQYNVGQFAGQGLGLVMSGSGILTLNGANDFGVGVTINSGTLAVGNNAALNGQGPLVLNGGAIQASGGARIVSPPQVRIAGNFAVTGLSDLTVNGSVDLNAGTRTVTVSAPTVTIGGAISNGGLNKEGPGTMILGGLSTHTGGTNVNEGVLQLNNGGASGAIRGTVGVLASGTLRLNAANSLGFGVGTKVDVINVVGGLIDNIADGDNGWGLMVNLNAATMRSNNGTNSTTTPKLYAMGGNSRIATIASGTSSLVSGRLQLREGNPSDRLPINVADGAVADDLIIRAAITESGGSYGITKQNTGTLLLVGGANDSTGAGSTYTGQTVVNAGTLAVDGSQNANRLSPNNQVIVNNGASFEVRGVNTLPLNANAVDVTVNQGGTFRVVSGGSAFIGGATESHAHIRNVTLNGGTVDLTYSGTLSNWNGESFQLNGSITTGGSAPSVIQTDAAVNRQGVGLDGVRTFQVADVTLSSAADLTINAELESSSTTPADDGLRKTGAGTLVLNHANTYLGQTVIDEGSLILNGSLAGATVINGGTLTGAGNARQVSVNAGGTLAPGVGIGTLSSESVTFNGGTLAIEINSSTLGRDTLAIIGSLILGGAPVSLNVTDLGNSGLAGGTSLTLLTYTGTWDGGLFSVNGSPLLDEQAFTVGMNSFRMDYGDASTKSFRIVAVPEARASVLLGLSAAFLGSFRRRRHSF